VVCLKKWPKAQILQHAPVNANVLDANAPVVDASAEQRNVCVMLKSVNVNFWGSSEPFFNIQADDNHTGVHALPL